MVSVLLRWCFLMLSPTWQVVQGVWRCLINGACRWSFIVQSSSPLCFSASSACFCAAMQSASLWWDLRALLRSGSGGSVFCAVFSYSPDVSGMGVSMRLLFPRPTTAHRVSGWLLMTSKASDSSGRTVRGCIILNTSVSSGWKVSSLPRL